MKYEVQEFCLCGGWTNTWTSEDETGAMLPSLFDTSQEAEAELDWYLKECQDEVEEGNMEDAPDREEFRIVEVA